MVVGGGGGGGGVKSSLYFTEDRTSLHQDAIGPLVSNCFSRGVHTSISKETASHL